MNLNENKQILLLNCEAENKGQCTQNYLNQILINKYIGIVIYKYK